MFRKNIKIADQSDVFVTRSQPRSSLARRLLGFFRFTAEDRLNAGVHVRGEGDDDGYDGSSNSQNSVEQN